MSKDLKKDTPYSEKEMDKFLEEIFKPNCYHSLHVSMLEEDWFALYCEKCERIVGFATFEAVCFLYRMDADGKKSR